MYNIETARVFNQGDTTYLVLIDDDNVHGVGRELWYSDSARFEIIGTTAIGFPSNIPLEVMEFCQSQITENEWSAWKAVND